MGIFSSKTKRYVDTQVQRVVEDAMVPSALSQAIMESLFDDSDLVTSIQDSALHGSFRNFERMYRFAERGDYFYGLPNVRFLSSSEGAEEAEAAILADTGRTDIDVEYLYFRPLNNIHEGWRFLTDQWGYNDQTNRIGQLESENPGFEYFLEKMVAVHFVPEGETIDRAALGTWGRSSASGYTPERPTLDLTSPIAPVLQQTTQDLVTDHDMRIGADETESVEIHYTWLDANGDQQRGIHVVDLSGYNPELEFFQAKYTYFNGVRTVDGYWTYDINDGRHPALDRLFNAPDFIDPGTYFPFVVFRSEQQNRAIDDGSERFNSTKELLDIIGADFEEMGKALSETEGIEDIRQGVMMMGVPITTDNEVELEYLWRYFYDLAQRLPQNANTSRVQSFSSRTGATGGAPEESYALQITDADFLGTISFDRITTELKAGNFGAPGSYEAFESRDEVINPRLDVSQYSNVGSRPVRVFRRQLMPNLVQEVRVVNPVFRYNIRYELTTEGGVDDERFLVPLDYEICKQMSSFKLETLYYRSLHFVFNSYVEQKVKWYERGAFGILLQIVAVVITIYTFGATWKATLAAAAAAGGTSAVVSALINIIVTSLFKALVFQFAFTELVEVLGIDFAYFLAIAAAAAGGYYGLQAGGFTSGSLATNLLTASNGLVTGVQRTLGNLFRELQADIEAFIDEAEALTEELAEVQRELDSNIGLDPFTFIAQPMTLFGEPPGIYFERTIHAGNVGAESLNFIQNFVDTSLRLPSIDETIGDSFNAA